MKKTIWIICAGIILVIIAFRASVIISESRRTVFNIDRNNAEYGVPVQTVVAKKKTGTLREPVHIKNGRASVACFRIGKFHVGQSVSGGGKITSVSKNINLDTGLCSISVNAPDGDKFVEIMYDGIFVPVSAIKNKTVFVSVDNIAVSKEIKIIASDNDMAVLSGLSDGEIIILSNVVDGQKIRLKGDQ